MKRAPLAGGHSIPLQEDDVPAIAGGVPTRAPEHRLVFGAPVIGDREIDSVVECLRSNWIGLGARVEQFEHAFAAYKQAPYAAAVSSGTAAIHLALLAMGIGPGDEVIVPAMTFCSTVHSIVHTGARPVLIDCDRQTLNIDPRQVESRITAQTKAILVVHMCGRPCDMDPIMAIAERRGLKVVEDCAHAIETTYERKPAGLIGDAGCFSFYPTKNIATCDGGMVITRHQAVQQKVKILSLHGMTADAWSRFVGGPTGYEVVEAGFKYNMTDVAAALALPQIQTVEENWKCRERVWQMYNQGLRELPLELPAMLDSDSRHAYHLYTPLLKLESLSVGRDQLIAALDAENIGIGIHYVPVHQHPYYRNRFGYRNSDFPNATFVGERTLSLPLSPAMSDRDVADVTSALSRIFRYYKVSS